MNEYKKRVEQAMQRHHQRQLPDNEPKPPSRQNQKPEEKFVATPCRKWMKKKGWHVNPIEAKSVWSKAREKWVASHVRAGTPDCNATDAYGFACWVEFKAPGKLNSVHRNPKQVIFIREQIKRNAFACVVDSVHQLEQIYDTWIDQKISGNHSKARDYLYSKIPPPPKFRDQGPLFDE